MFVTAVYISPSLARFERILEDLAKHLQSYGGSPMIVAGDFNSRSTLWGDRITNLRGRLLEDWAASLGLCCMNTRMTSTCVRTTGESAVDVTWASPGLKEEKESKGQRWAVQKLNKDIFEAAIIASSWPTSRQARDMEDCDPNTETDKLQRIALNACDVAMPRAKTRLRKSVHWWNEVVALLREDASRARRAIKRARRRRSEPEEIEARVNEYRTFKKKLRVAIYEAKERSWRDLVKSLNEDPWGTAYKLVLNKLRHWTVPITESLDPPFLEEVLNTLFPPPENQGEEEWRERDSLPSVGSGRWVPSMEVSHEKMQLAVRKMNQRKAAPGPSGVPSQAWTMVTDGLFAIMRELFTKCLKDGVFPEKWKQAKLVLLANQPMTPRATGKYASWMRRRRSSSALMGLERRSRQLRCPITSGESCEHTSRTSTSSTRTKGERPKVEGSSAEPQGSVLGPCLLTLGYNEVLRNTDLPEDCGITAYADDTFVLAGGQDWQEAVLKANETVVNVVFHIKSLGLSISAGKSEDSLKYLGVIVVSRWTYERQFQVLSERLLRAAGNLAKILPNIGGPSPRIRRLHATVLDSIALYAAPAWMDKVEKNRLIQCQLQQAQRRIACRTIRGFRTVSFATATILAGTPPLLLKAQMYANVYEAMQKLRSQGMKWIPPSVSEPVRSRERNRMLRNWEAWIRSPGQSGGEVGIELRPHLQKWAEAKIGLTYRCTQLLTGHGCFGQYLHKIKKEKSARYWHCPARLHTAQHTREECPAWGTEES
ncbi:PREDICTED: uncharacterized protein LOC108759241 [Trachymyrmex cornetzi]|uniref:uncharacterized protein LOC108759241 n=1 Tax=Trachymyrmex cornetzi TaxID=471704 RepID=UPI00084F4997|nr:PREDICTED: uncharacterized protein LOC108759241 [Trachymyrmex cornetzi]